MQIILSIFLTCAKLLIKNELYKFFINYFLYSEVNAGYPLAFIALFYNLKARNPMSLRIRIKEWGQRALFNLNLDQSGQPSMELNMDRPVSSLDLILEFYFSFASIYMVC